MSLTILYRVPIKSYLDIINISLTTNKHNREAAPTGEHYTNLVQAKRVQSRLTAEAVLEWKRNALVMLVRRKQVICKLSNYFCVRCSELLLRNLLNVCTCGPLVDGVHSTARHMECRSEKCNIAAFDPRAKGGVHYNDVSAVTQTLHLSDLADISMDDVNRYARKHGYAADSLVERVVIYFKCHHVRSA